MDNFMKIRNLLILLETILQKLTAREQQQLNMDNKLFHHAKLSFLLVLKFLLVEIACFSSKGEIVIFSLLS